MDIIEKEKERLLGIQDAILRFADDRHKKIAHHDAHAREIEKERLDAVDWREKNELSGKLEVHGHHNPRKYLVEFTHQAAPYFGILGIHDNNPRIGRKEYLIGNQTLMDGNRVVIIDWRKAEISSFFYDGYEIGEAYEETFRNVDREGVVTRRDKVTIARKVLHRIETPSEVYELHGDEWQKNGAASESSAETKIQSEDHRMVENIAALISPEQFRAITKQRTGAVVISGVAGSGKTTVALHRLSFLIYDDPEKYVADKCLVVMFNRTLRDYVRTSCENLLGAVRVDTYSAWALSALGALGVHSLRAVFDDPYGAQKKSSKISELLSRYVKETKRIESVADLWRFFTQDYLIEGLFGDSGNEFLSVAQRKFESKERNVSFADISLLLWLAQMRRPADAIVSGALNSYAHVVVDEAQDLTLPELETILAATSVDKSLTLCADEKQQISSFLDSKGFSSFMAKLHSQGLDKESMTVSYRCPKEIIDLAAHVSGRAVDSSKAHAGVLEFHPTKNAADSMATVRKLAKELAEAAPGSLTGIICKKKSDVKALHAVLAGLPGLHKEGEITFGPGIQIAHAHAIKGVEFSNVILFNPSSNDFRQTDPDRNLLYVCITRAAKTLRIVHHQPLAKGLSMEVEKAATEADVALATNGNTIRI